MTDKELIKLAAKACSELTSKWYDNDAYFGVLHLSGGVVKMWNPLNDDSDALRLSIDLSFTVSIYGKKEVRVIWRSIGGSRREVREMFANDRYSATRRAIVRAAAEIGKQLR